MLQSWLSLIACKSGRGSKGKGVQKVSKIVSKGHLPVGGNGDARTGNEDSLLQRLSEQHLFE